MSWDIKCKWKTTSVNQVSFVVVKIEYCNTHSNWLSYPDTIDFILSYNSRQQKMNLLWISYFLGGWLQMKETPLCRESRWHPCLFLCGGHSELHSEEKRNRALFGQRWRGGTNAGCALSSNFSILVAIINFDCRNEPYDRETSESVMVKWMLVEIFMPICCMCTFVEKNRKIITQPFSLSYLYPLKVFGYKSLKQWQ